MVARKLVAVVFFTVLACLGAEAQVRGGLQGRVLETSGAAIPNAAVELIEEATNLRRSTFTSKSGDYRFAALNPGQYRLSVSAAGFQNLIRTHITVAVGQTANGDAILAVGS